MEIVDAFTSVKLRLCDVLNVIFWIVGEVRFRLCEPLKVVFWIVAEVRFRSCNLLNGVFWIVGEVRICRFSTAGNRWTTAPTRSKAPFDNKVIVQFIVHSFTLMTLYEQIISDKKQQIYLSAYFLFSFPDAN